MHFYLIHLNKLNNNLMIKYSLNTTQSVWQRCKGLKIEVKAQKCHTYCTQWNNWRLHAFD